MSQNIECKTAHEFQCRIITPWPDGTLRKCAGDKCMHWEFAPNPRFGFCALSHTKK